MADRFPRIAALKTADTLRAHLAKSDITLRFDDVVESGPGAPLAAPMKVDGVRVGNRFCILPMEGWDGTADGRPSDFTRRRWEHFGASGAKLIWGGEAVAVRHDGRASPNQLLLTEHTQRDIAALRDILVATHRAKFGANADSDLFIGLQLTHSGRYAKPDAKDRPDPLIGYEHPILDGRFPNGVRLLSDDDLDRLIDDFIVAARLAHGLGFQFVDVKQCHGYLGHELLAARSRSGKYGGSFDNRTRFVRTIVQRIHSEVPGLVVGVRLSVFDLLPYRKGANGVGEPDRHEVGGETGFGVLVGEDMAAALDEPRQLLEMLRGLGVKWVCITAGSPYYCPHVQRPAYFPPMDGYQPPEDPLRGVERQIAATALVKRSFPDLAIVGSGYSYLQEWLPNVGQHNVRAGMTDFVGLGRMALSYPELPADVLSGTPLKRKLICRTFSDCTTGPRLGFVSGCYPLDAYYEALPEAAEILRVRTAMRT